MSSLTVDILLSLDGRADQWRDLWRSLELNTARDRVGKILVDDRHADSTTQTWWQECLAQSPLADKIVLNQTSTADCAVNLTAGMLLPPFWLERVATALAENPAAHQLIPRTSQDFRLNAGQTWQDMDRILKSRPAKYPSADRGPAFASRPGNTGGPRLTIDNLCLFQKSATNRSRPRFAWNDKGRPIDALFVLPGVLPKIGGIEMVLKVVFEALNRGHRVAILAEGPIDIGYVEQVGVCSPFLSRSMLYQQVRNISQVWATSFDSVATARAVSRHYGSKLNYFVQGPEGVFDSGRWLAVAAADYAAVDEILTGSDFLREYVTAYGAKKVSSIELSPDDLFFYPQNKPRVSNRILACLRGNVAKGTGVLLHNLTLAQQAGFEIQFFGKDSDEFRLPKDLGTHLGDLDPGQLRDALSQAEFYLDCSYFEGLGLLPLEAAYTGAIPLVVKNGGTESLFIDGKTALFLPQAFSNGAFFKQLAAMPPAQRDELRGHLACLREGRRWATSMDRFSARIPRQSAYSVEAVVNGENVGPSLRKFKQWLKSRPRAFAKYCVSRG